MKLAQPGSELSVGLPATLKLDDADGQVIYASATMSELQQLPSDQASALLVRLPSLTGYTDVYEMPVSLTILGVITDAGQPTSRASALTSSALSRFAIVPHQGSDLLPTSNTLSDDSCRGLASSTPITAGQTITWCVHAFARAGDPAPAGGQYQALSGAYRAPILWASRIFGSSVVIP